VVACDRSLFYATVGRKYAGGLKARPYDTDGYCPSLRNFWLHYQNLVHYP